MPFYKDTENKLHWLDSADFQYLLPVGSVEITDEEATAIQSPAPTQAEIIASYTATVQKHLDDTAKQRGYDGILSACTYATSTNEKFQAEGQAAVVWRDAVWSTCYATLAAVESGATVIPTIDELISVLPAVVWP